jgi:hypothetical protein
MAFAHGDGRCYTESVFTRLPAQGLEARGDLHHIISPGHLPCFIPVSFLTLFRFNLSLLENTGQWQI